MAAECEVYATHELAVHSRSRTCDHVLVLVFSLRPASDAASIHEGDHDQDDDYADPHQRM